MYLLEEEEEEGGKVYRNRWGGL